MTYDLFGQPPGTSFFTGGDSVGVLDGVVPTDSLFLTPPPGLSNIPFKLLLSTITVTGEAGLSVSVNHEIRITLRQFPAEIGGDLVATLFEGEDSVAEGFLTISDRNDTEDRFQPIAAGDTPLPFSIFELSETGRWTYRFRDDLSDEAQATLRGATEGEVIEIQPLEVLSVDGTGKLMTLNIFGSNDTPELVSFVFDQMLTKDDEDDPTATLLLDPTQFFFDADFSHAANLEFTLNGTAFNGQREFAVGEHVLTLRATDPLDEFVEDTFTLTVEQGGDPI